MDSGALVAPFAVATGVGFLLVGMGVAVTAIGWPGHFSCPVICITVARSRRSNWPAHEKSGPCRATADYADAPAKVRSNIFHTTRLFLVWEIPLLNVVTGRLDCCARPGARADGPASGR